MADLFNYIFQFPDRATAQSDAVVGPFYNLPNASAPLEVIVFGNVLVDSVTPLSGFWPMINKPAPVDATLSTHPNIQIVNNRTAQLAGAPGVVLANIPIAHLGIILNGLGNYVADGLQ